MVIQISISLFKNKKSTLIGGGIILFILLFFVIIGGLAGGFATQQQDDCSNEDSDSAPVSSIGKMNVKKTNNYLQNIKNIATADAPKVHVAARILFAQLYAESGPDGSQPVVKKDNNYGGMTWSLGSKYPKGTTRGVGGSEGGWYRHYKNLGEFAQDWGLTLKRNFARTGKPRSITDYVNKQKSQNYMRSNDLAGYASRMRTGWKLWTGKSVLSSAARVADNAASDTGEDCDDSGSSFKASGDILKEAKHWLHKFHYSYARSADAHWRHPSANDTTDCSGFVWLILKRAGYKVPSLVWSTPTMESDAKGPHHYLRQISSKNAKAGDIIVVNRGEGSGQNGHTAFLLENYHGNNTKIIEEGGDSSYNRVNIRTIGYAFSSLISGGRTTFCTPKKK